LENNGRIEVLGMADMLRANDLAKKTKVDVNSVKAMIAPKKAMALDDFNKMLDANYANLRAQLAKKDVFTNAEICAIFGCSMYTGMPRCRFG
jgi:hypothetical protein